MTVYLNAVAVAVIVISIVQVVRLGGVTSASVGPGGPRGESRQGAPDIYLLLLDGYPRADTLQSRLAYDNRPFLSDMEALGFDVAYEGHSNYDFTILTLASMLNAAQFPTLMPDPPADLTSQYRQMTRLLNRGSALAPFRIDGYEVVSIPSGHLQATLLDADRVLDSGELSTFEMELLRKGSIPRLIGGIERSWIPAEHRSRMLETLSAVEGLSAERGGPPKVVFAHVLVPHMPATFGRDGGPVEPLPCFPAACHCSTSATDTPIR